jgi:hypothetical protein
MTNNCYTSDQQFTASVRRILRCQLKHPSLPRSRRWLSVRADPEPSIRFTSEVSGLTRRSNSAVADVITWSH